MLAAIHDIRTVWAAAAMLAGILTLAGCGGADPAAPAPTGVAATQPAATSAAPVVPASKLPIGTRTGDCGDAKVAVNKVLNAATAVTDEVTSIDADPGCTELILSTTLDRSAGAEAIKVCQALAPAAYANGFTTVTVRAVGQAHSAAGNFVRAVDGGPCTTV